MIATLDLRRRDLATGPCAQHTAVSSLSHPIRHPSEPGPVVCNDHDRQPEPAAKVEAASIPPLPRALLVERRRWLIEQQRLGLEHERSASITPLLLPDRAPEASRLSEAASRPTQLQGAPHVRRSPARAAAPSRRSPRTLPSTGRRQLRNEADAAPQREEVELALVATAKATTPESGSASPSNSRSRVDFPDPDGPADATRLLRAALRSPP